MIKNERLKEWIRRQDGRTGCEIIRIFGVEYAHIHFADESDLYVTVYGLPFMDFLRPENFYTDPEWFKANSVRLSGTSAIYRVHTKPVNGRSKEIVLKWNRMGQDIPGAHEADILVNAEFNSPFEEFAHVADLKARMSGQPAGV
ncbi:MAG: hypothetical protein HQL11_04270, partial [Candidatus Omnitrophica bacterium]|nr:hypothetical protein [Candidatus Omnitrophota bacterium]